MYVWRKCKYFGNLNKCCKSGVFKVVFFYINKLWKNSCCDDKNKFLCMIVEK